MRFDLHFEYDSPKKVVYEWWTDLSGKGYVGRSLKAIEPFGEEDRKIMVKTKWVIMGFNMLLTERLTLDPPDRWIWEPHMMGIDIMDEFRLEQKGEGAVLHIRSDMKPRGLKGRVVYRVLGWWLKRMMIAEWKAADRALRVEINSRDSSVTF